MNEDQKTGTLIIIVAVALVAVVLVLSKGWGVPGFSLYLHQFECEYNPDPTKSCLVIETSYVLAVLILAAGYGVARFFSVIPPIFRKRKSPTPDSETAR